MRTQSRTIFLLLVIVLLVGGPLACGGSDDGDSGGATESTPTTAGGSTATDSATSSTADSGKRLVVGRDMDVNSLDPHRSYCDTCQIYVTATYQTLIGLDMSDNQTLIPRLAAEWSINDDLTEITFTLDDRATFSDGSEVEAKDVKWSLERLKNLKGSPAYFVDTLESVETPDTMTVVLMLNRPDSAMLAKLASPYTAIVNSDVAAENGASAAPDADSTDTAEQWFLQNSAGSGPYVLANYQEEEEIAFVANENYWMGEVAIKEVTIRETKDAVTQRQLLEGGDISIAMQINPDIAKDMESGDDIIIEMIPSFNFLYLSLSPGAEGADDILNDAVRDAIRYAIDYEGLIEVTLGGAGKKQAAPIPNGFAGTKDLPLPERNLEKAKQLMAEGGFPGGFTIDARYPNVNSYGVDFNVMMQKIQADLTEIGIQLNLVPIEKSVWFEERANPGIPVSAGYFAPDHTDSSQYVEYFGMVPNGAWAGRVTGGNGEMVNQKETDLYAEALAAADEAEREDLYRQIGMEMIEESFIVTLVNPDLILAYSSDVQGVHYSGCCNLELERLSWK